MSEFKFACPVCGQHITADSTNGGSQIECPTCFQKLIVPQAPAGGDSKLIVSASLVGKPRPVPSEALADAGAMRPPSSAKWAPIALGLALLVIAAGAAALISKKQIFKSSDPGSQGNASRQQTQAAKKAAPRVVYSIPTNVVWTLDLTNAAIPEMNAAGNIHGSGFMCERATLTESNLWMRQGRASVADLGINIQFFSRDLSGKTIELASDRDPPVPTVSLRWKNDQQKLEREDFHSGYLLRVTFGEAAGGRLPGKIYVCLPDKSKSVVAGTFSAEIRKPPVPKAPKVPKKT